MALNGQADEPSGGTDNSSTPLFHFTPRPTPLLISYKTPAEAWLKFATPTAAVSPTGPLNAYLPLETIYILINLSTEPLFLNHVMSPKSSPIPPPLPVCTGHCMLLPLPVIHDDLLVQQGVRAGAQHALAALLHVPRRLYDTGLECHLVRGELEVWCGRERLAQISLSLSAAVHPHVAQESCPSFATSGLSACLSLAKSGCSLFMPCQRASLLPCMRSLSCLISRCESRLRSDCLMQKHFVHKCTAFLTRPSQIY